MAGAGVADNVFPPKCVASKAESFSGDTMGTGGTLADDDAADSGRDSSSGGVWRPVSDDKSWSEGGLLSSVKATPAIPTAKSSSSILALGVVGISDWAPSLLNPRATTSAARGVLVPSASSSGLLGTMPVGRGLDSTSASSGSSSSSSSQSSGSLTSASRSLTIRQFGHMNCG